jgi:hypothetical protein
MTINREWHAKNRMPKNPTAKQRLEWHLSHSRNCDCRKIMPKVIAELKRKASGAD